MKSRLCLYGTLGCFVGLAACSAQSDFTGGGTPARFDSNSREAAKKEILPESDGQSSAGGIEKGLEEAGYRLVENWTFDTKADSEVNQEFSAQNKTVTSTLQPQLEEVPWTRELSQVDRQLVQLNHVQGYPQMARAETFSQNQSGLIDILVVMDNTGSMSEEQQGLATKIGDLVNQLGAANWQIAVTTMDSKERGLRALIRSADANRVTAFSNAILAGTKGANEHGVFKAVEGLNANQPGSSLPWLRQSSNIAVLLVSDEDNCTFDKPGTNSCAADPWGTPNYLLNRLTELRPNAGDARVYGIFRKQGVPCPTALAEAPQYEFAVTQTGGHSGSICDADYGPTLRAISGNLKSILKSRFQLKAIPDPSSLVVKVNGAISSGYVVKGDVVEFQGSSAPPLGAAISVDYKTQAVGTNLSSIPLDPQVDLSTLELMVNGQIQNQSSFRINSTSRELTFNSTPAPTSQISLSYRKGELSQLFSIPSLSATDSEKDLIGKVSVGNKVLTPQDYRIDAQNMKLSLNQHPSDGQKIKIEGILRRVKLAPQDLAELSKSSRLVSAVLLETGETVPGALQPVGNGLSFFASPAWLLGRSADLPTTLRIVAEDASPVQKLPIPASLQSVLDIAATVDGQLCPTATYVPESKEIVIDSSDCAINKDSKINVKYRTDGSALTLSLPIPKLGDRDSIVVKTPEGEIVDHVLIPPNKVQLKPSESLKENLKKVIVSFRQIMN